MNKENLICHDCRMPIRAKSESIIVKTWGGKDVRMHVLQSTCVGLLKDEVDSLRAELREMREKP